MEYQDVENMLKIVNQELEKAGSLFHVEMREDNLYVVLKVVYKEGKHEITLKPDDQMILSEAFRTLEGIILGLKLSRI